MKKFGVIFQYEIMNYIKNKSFMISTIVIAVLAAVILFLPSVFDMSGIWHPPPVRSSFPAAQRFGHWRKRRRRSDTGYHNL